MTNQEFKEELKHSVKHFIIVKANSIEDPLRKSGVVMFGAELIKKIDEFDTVEELVKYFMTHAVKRGVAFSGFQ